MNLTRDNALYRRGLVLGLTMAEIMLLLLFVLLLALSFLLEEEKKQLEAVQQTVERQAQQLAQFEELKATLAAAAADPSRIKDLFRELEIARSERKDALERVEQLSEKLEEAQAEAEKAKDFQELQAVLADSGMTAERAVELVEKEKVADAVASAGLPTDPAELDETLGKVAELDASVDDAHAVVEAVREAGLFDEPQALKEQLTNLAQLREQLDQMAGEKLKAEQYAQYFKRLAGNQMPPCWMDEEHRAEYIFDVELLSDGIVVYDRKLPEYREEQKKLPLDGIAYERTMSQDEFGTAFRPLYNWSVEQECRFFVRIFDRTGEAEKERYKALLRRVEGYFYKLLVNDSGIRPGSA